MRPLTVVLILLAMDCERCGKYLKSNQIDNVRRHYDSDSCKRKTAAAISLHASQPPDKRQWLLCTSATTTASPEERSTCNESFASNVWSYHYLDHMQSVHPSQTLTEEEVLKYALRKEEYIGVLGKEYVAKNQERRLAMDLTKLNSDATSVTNPALFWSKVVLVQYR